MRNGPEFLAVGVWCLFAAVIAVAHGTGATVAQDKTETVVASSDKITTGRSAAVMANNGPYGALFIDPSLSEGAPVIKGPKPSSADLTAK